MNTFDVVVVGGGHSGIEASLAASRLGCSVALVTLNKSAIGRMSCNPAIGGLAKGHLVREIDALGGQMALSADSSGIQFKILNKSKGRAVWSPRAQIDKKKYEQLIQSIISSQHNIRIIEAEARHILTQYSQITSVILDTDIKLSCTSLVLTCGTFLNGLVHIGRRKIRAGRMGEEASNGITESLVSLGFISGRLKTGTPPRLNKETINFDSVKDLHGDKQPRPFSFRTHNFSPPDYPCHLTNTSPETHKIIINNLHRSPMYCGEIQGVGPRYCPSIEDKVVRFPEKDSHQIFLEPEWSQSNQIYTNGFSTSLPEDVQLKALRTVKGLEKVVFVRPGYAIEYDFFPPSQLKSSLETKNVKGLFFAGQINGTSGYEEAAAQGLIAGINAANYVNNHTPLILNRNEAYLGVLIDDLVTKDTLEPYRMFTARAEYRLLLRHTNADRRLSQIGHSLGLISEQEYELVAKKIDLVDSTIDELSSISIQPYEANHLLSELGETTISQSTSLSSLLKRPPVSLKILINSDLYSFQNCSLSNIALFDVLDEVETTIKYQGYIQQQNHQVQRLAKNESVLIPPSFDYFSCNALSSEAREKLSSVCPETLGQASRISGVSPSDVAVLAVLLLSK